MGFVSILVPMALGVRGYVILHHLPSLTLACFLLVKNQGSRLVFSPSSKVSQSFPEKLHFQAGASLSIQGCDFYVSFTVVFLAPRILPGKYIVILDFDDWMDTY